MKFGTRVLHTGTEVDSATGAVSVPIYHSSTYDQRGDVKKEFDYSRSGNPTRKAVEGALAVLEDGARGFTFASGMAAISTVLALFSAGDHLLITRDVYGGTYRVLTKVFSRFGIEFDFIDTIDLSNIRKQVRPNTRGLYLESPSNPLLKITDIKGACEIAKEHGLITMADNTFMTPYFQNPLQLGADIVIHSATKFLGGHSDLLAGVVVASDKKLCQEIAQLQNAIGAVLDPHSCWLLMRGIKTLKVRMEQHQQGALKIAEWLKDHPLIDRVYYPGLPEHPGHETVKQQCRGFGGVLSFVTKDETVTKRLMQEVKVPVVAVSLGAVESILSYPAAMSHAAIPLEERLQLGISDNLLRLSVGLEEPEDLIADLEQVLGQNNGC